MRTLTHLHDEALLHNLMMLVERDRATTATLLAYLAEVDERRLYAPAGYPSMYAYCIGALRLSEDAAAKRIHAARTARAYPALFDAVADGRLHMTAVRILAPYLTAENLDELIADATHRCRADIEQILVRRFPRTEVLRLDEGIAALAPGSADSAGEHAPEHVDSPEPASPQAPVALAQHAPGHAAPQLRTLLTPITPQRFSLQVTISKATHDKLRHVQALLGHTLPSGEVAEVLDRALDALIAQIEKQKCATTTSPRSEPRPTLGRRHIPAHVRRAVWERDGGRCTFVGHQGLRCEARRFLEFDHVDPVARGGRATAERMRLRCRTHNQLEAERVFGKEFMNQKRERTVLGGTAAVRADQAKDQAKTGGTRVPPVKEPMERPAIGDRPP